MYTQEQEQLRLSLVQFLGAILSNSNFAEPEMRRQSLTALVTEELVKVCKSGENVDMVAAKPILRATQHIIHTREQEIRSELEKSNIDNEQIEDAVEDMTWLRTDLEKYIDAIK